MKTKFKSQRKGAVLMTVTMVATMMVVIVAAGISLVAHTSKKTNEVYRRKQAYFAASSCLEAFVSETTGFSLDAGHTAEQIAEAIDMLQGFANDPETTVKIQKLSGGVAGADVSADNARWRDIEVKLKIEAIGGNTSSLKAISTATYLGEQKTVVAYLSIKHHDLDSPVPNALELIGTSGTEASYNNINVYGNTSAPLQDSDSKNAVYQFDTNGNEFYGDMSILGSAVNGVTFALRQNPYFVDQKTTPDQSPGCTLQVSRSFHSASNVAKLTSNQVKGYGEDNAPYGVKAYNYINVMDAFIMSGSGAQIGEPGTYDPSVDAPGTPDWKAANARMVDIYASLFVVGPMDSVTDLADWCAEGAANPADYKLAMRVGAGREEQGNDQKIYGNVYTYNNGGHFNGDIYIIGINNDFYGDVCSSGDIYLYDNETRVNFHGEIYLAPGKHFKRSDGSNYTPPASWSVHYDSNWQGASQRARRPVSPYDTVVPYYYYPEHLMCEPGSPSLRVSTICKTYASMYDSSNKIKASAPKLSDFKNTSDAVYNEYDTGVPGVEIRPNYIVTKSCVIDMKMEGTIVIDLDAADTNLDGGNDIVLIMQDTEQQLGPSGQFVGDARTTVLVKCSADPESDNARFAYFVTDSGVGRTNNEYASDGTISTYDHSSFKTVNIKCGNGQLVLMDMCTYAHSDYVSGNSYSINPTKRTTSSNVYDLSSGNIVMLMTEGCSFTAGQESIIQATVFMPRATFTWMNNGSQKVKIEPNYSIWSDAGGNRLYDELTVNILGSLVCKQFRASVNNNTVVYQPVSTKSMVAITLGAGKSVAEESFQLVRYANS